MAGLTYSKATAILTGRRQRRRSVARGFLLLPNVALILAIGAQLAEPAAATQAYAPKAELPAGADANSMIAAMLSNASVPETDAVGVPAYPGARVVQAMNVQNPVTRAQTGTVRLISNDSPEAVAAWYEENLTGWRRSEAMGMIGFGEGGREFNPMRPDTWGVVPSVKIEGDDLYEYGQVWLGVQAVIEISYALD
jgi:hypothetical protein